MTSAVKSACGITRLTRPSRTASSADTFRAENRRSMAWGRPISRGSSQDMPCSAIRPRREKAVVNTAVSEAKRRSV